MRNPFTQKPEQKPKRFGYVFNLVPGGEAFYVTFASEAAREAFDAGIASMDGFPPGAKALRPGPGQPGY